MGSIIYKRQEYGGFSVVDSTVTSDSNNPVSSKAVYEAIEKVKTSVDDVEVTLTTDDWAFHSTDNTYKQTVTVEGLLTNNNPIIMLKSEQETEEELNAYALLDSVSIDGDNITFIAREILTTAITVVVKDIMTTESYGDADIDALENKVKTLEDAKLENAVTVSALETKVDNLEIDISKFNSNISHVGMVIHSTTLDTMDKVIAIYGGTTWEKIEGQFLLGQSSNYAVNSTGGSATNTLTTANLPSHSHTVGAHSHGLNNHTHTIPELSGTAVQSGAHTHENYVLGWSASELAANKDSFLWAMGTNTSNHAKTNLVEASAGAHIHTVTTVANTTGGASGSTANSTAFNSGNTGNGTAVNNMPPYKTVYIWERTA